jgi:hypothetical protein
MNYDYDTLFKLLFVVEPQVTVRKAGNCVNILRDVLMQHCLSIVVRFVPDNYVVVDS